MRNYAIFYKIKMIFLMKYKTKKKREIILKVHFYKKFKKLLNELMMLCFK